MSIEAKLTGVLVGESKFIVASNLGFLSIKINQIKKENIHEGTYITD